MDRKSIITLPKKSLRLTSKKVASVNEDTLRLIADMKAATLDWEDSRAHEVGVALAAVQVDKLERVVIVRDSFEKNAARTFSVYINPEIIKYEGTIVKDYEGCLSVKDIYGFVPRYSKVRVKALDENGKPITVRAEGFLARIFQHEIDHTNGILFVDHIKDNEKAFFRLKEDGKLEPLDYDQKIRDNKDLWNE